MKNNLAISLKNVSKKFCLHLENQMKYGAIDVFQSVFLRKKGEIRLREDEFWAVKDISFDIEKGESVGLAGPNGSGKSTILKMINGIFLPDSGEIEINGTVGALIEIGSGFHPLLTGRENVYLNGSILGMGKKEIDKKFNEILDFSGVQEFIDMPVKNYSSGMYVRLAFSIAAHLETDILLIDEILAVGDSEFQQKCVEKILSLKKLGKTIVFVSHDDQMLKLIVDRIIDVSSK